MLNHDDVIKWKHFPRNWPFVRKIHRSPVNFPHKGQWRGALMFSLIYVWINDWANNREAGDLRRQHGHYDVIVMLLTKKCHWILENEHRNPIINRVHDPTKVTGFTEYEQNPLNIVGCGVITRAGQMDEWMDRRRRAQQYPTAWMGRGWKTIVMQFSGPENVRK